MDELVLGFLEEIVDELGLKLHFLNDETPPSFLHITHKDTNKRPLKSVGCVMGDNALMRLFYRHNSRQPSPQIIVNLAHPTSRDEIKEFLRKHLE